MKKLLLLLLLLFPLWLNAQVVPDATIKSNTNTLIRTADPVLRASHSMINDQLTDSKMSRIENNQVSGTNTYSISLIWVNTYSKGLKIPVFFTNGNSGASTININLLGATQIRINGVPLVGGEITSNIPYELIYDGTFFELSGGAVSYSGALNRISVTGSLIDISPSYIGQTSITTLGTVVTGTWNGTRLTASYTPQGQANSVWGVTGASVGDQASIIAGLDGNVLRRSGSNLSFGSLDLTNSGTVGSSILPTSNGGTGTATPNLIAGSNVTITGTWPNQTINASGTAGAWLLASGGTLTGANTITGTSSNTIKYVFNSLGTTQTDGAGLWLQNSTAASLGNQQISPLITWEGQGWASGVNNSQSVKYAIDVLPIQRATNPSGTWRLRQSINGVAYSDVLTYDNFSGIFTFTGAQLNVTSSILALAVGGTERTRLISTGDFLIGSTTDNARLYVSQAALSSSWLPALRVDAGAHTGITASTELLGSISNHTAVTQQWATGTLATQRFNYFGAPTLSFVGASTANNVYNVYIEAPVAGTNATIAASYALGLNGDLAFTAGDRSLWMNNMRVRSSASGNLTITNNSTGYGLLFTSSNIELNSPGNIYLRSQAVTANQFYIGDQTVSPTTARILATIVGPVSSASTAYAPTTGTSGLLQIGASNGNGNFQPTSGSATHTTLLIKDVINQTGTANGAITYFDINPTRTSVLGSEYGILVRPSQTLNGFGTATPTANIHLVQAGLSSIWGPAFRVDAGAHIGMTAGTEFFSTNFTFNTQQWATGTLSQQRWIYLGSPTPSFVGASTLTNGFTLYVDPPTAGTNATITNSWAFGTGGDAKISGRLLLVQPSLSSGWNPAIVSTPGTHTALTAATEFISRDFQGVTQTWVDGTTATQRFNYFKGYTLNKTTTSATFTNVYTVYIDPSTAGTGVTLTNNWALGLNGAVRLFAGTTSMPPLVFQSGTNSSSIINGAVEFDGTHFYGAISGSRVQLDNQVSSFGWLASGATTITGNTSQSGAFTETMAFNSITLNQNAVNGVNFPNALSVQIGSGSGTLTGASSNTTALAVNTTVSSLQFNSGSMSQIWSTTLSGKTTYSFTGSTTVTNTGTVLVSGIAQAGTNASITNAHGLYVISGPTTGTVTNTYGLTVEAQTGATNNYTAQFLGGNVGFKTSSPVSTAEVSGSFGTAITTSTGNLTLDDTHYTIIISSGTGTYTLPSASSATKRIYVLINQTGTGRTISTYKDKSNASQTSIAANSSLIIQSDGTNWYQIN